MYKLAGRTIDFLDDPECMGNAEFCALIGGAEKFAARDGVDSDFAVVLRGKDKYRRFPLFDKMATVLSANYFVEHVEQLHPYIRVVAAYHIKQACSAFGVDVPAAVTRYSQVPVPLTSNVLDLCDMPDYQHTAPVKTAEAVVDAMTAFWVENLRHMTPAERSSKASQIVSMPGVKIAQLPPSVIDYAAKNTYGTLLGPAIQQRVRLMKRAANEAAALEYAEIIKSADELEPEEIAKMLTVVDTKHKVAAMYGRIADPYLAVYGRLHKTAAEEEAEQPDLDSTGLRYKLETMAAEANGYRYHSVLSESGAKEFAKDPVGTFKRLPKIVQDFLLADFDAHLRKNKEMPVNPHMSDVSIKRRTEEMRNGEYTSGPLVYDPKAEKKERENAKYPKMVTEPVAKG